MVPARPRVSRDASDKNAARLHQIVVVLYPLPDPANELVGDSSVVADELSRELYSIVGFAACWYAL
jgi:hypothetical protein